jgi:hypothetical protein
MNPTQIFEFTRILIYSENEKKNKSNATGLNLPRPSGIVTCMAHVHVGRGPQRWQQAMTRGTPEAQRAQHACSVAVTSPARVWGGGRPFTRSEWWQLQRRTGGGASSSGGGRGG